MLNKATQSEILTGERLSRVRGEGGERLYLRDGQRFEKEQREVVRGVGIRLERGT